MSRDTELDQATYGVELEFLVVVAAKIKMNEDEEFVFFDPHPNDPRWISTKIPEWEAEEMREQVRNGEDLDDLRMPNDTFYDEADMSDWSSRLYPYARTRLTRVLREDGGLVVIKWPNTQINWAEDEFAMVNNFSESEESDDERESTVPNAVGLRTFRSSYTYDPTFREPVNVEAAVSQWETDYENFHTANNLKIYRTRSEDINALVERCTIVGWKGAREERQIRFCRRLLRARLEQRREREKQDREDERNRQVDPLHIPVLGLSDQYKAWTVTIDYSVDGEGMTVNRYANVNTVDPFGEYHWFGAEVVSPVLPLGDERAEDAIRWACGSLRNAFRIHKPMQVSTGLHVHVGHTKGWTLLQAKRFATFWFLTERTILTLHREDRGLDEKWCAKMGTGSRLWRALYSMEETERRWCADAINVRNSPKETQAYEREMAEHVPFYSLSNKDKGFIFYLWQYKRITDLNDGLGENKYCRPGVRWRIRGRQSSLDPPPDGSDPQPGTIEIRIMQGTLDADHINNWVRVLERVVDVTRNLSNEAFQELLARFLVLPTRDQLLRLLGVPDDLRMYWLDSKRRDDQDNWWEYPDKDKVDWEQPFMIPRHRATHHPIYDD